MRFQGKAGGFFIFRSEREAPPQREGGKYLTTSRPLSQEDRWGAGRVHYHCYHQQWSVWTHHGGCH